MQENDRKRPKQTPNRHQYRHWIFRVMRKLHRVAEEMEKLALEQTTDTRVKFQACKDILDRAGTAPAQRVAVNTPQTYTDALRSLLEDVSA